MIPFSGLVDKCDADDRSYSGMEPWMDAEPFSASFVQQEAAVFHTFADYIPEIDGQDRTGKDAGRA